MSSNCINCNIQLFRLRRHAISEQNQALVNVIRLWTYPREITPIDRICNACWQLASYQASTEDVPRRVFGHTHVCVVCGVSTLRINHQRVVAENDGEGLNRQRIIDVIANWIQPRQVTESDEICFTCWRRADRTGQQLEEVEIVNRPEQPVQNIEIENRPEPAAQEEVDVINRLEQPLQNIEIENRPEPAAQEEEVDVINRLEQPVQNIEIENRPEPAAQEEEVDIINRLEQLEITLPNFRRAADTARRCVFRGCLEAEHFVIPEHIRKNVLRNFQYFLPQNSRICQHHLENDNFGELYTAEYSMDNFRANHVEHMLFCLSERKSLSFENILDYPEGQVKYFIGITKNQYQSILNETPALRNMHRGSLGLTSLLCKLRTGDSGDRLSCLFETPRRTLETLMSKAREILTRDYVPHHLGFSHMTREQVSANNSLIADGLLGDPDAASNEKPAIVIADATYIYNQKSSNYSYQKKTYSLHKYRNLVKPFLMVCCNGYIIDVLGPYPATTNDATIMRRIMDNQDFENFFSENDIFVVDRGFRDAIDSIHDKGYIAHMPETKEDGQSQLTTLEANRTRCITINRWVVEAVNGRFKRDFKLFRQEYFNCASRHLMEDFRIAAALLNAFAVPFTDNINAERFVQRINDRLFMDNWIGELAVGNTLNRRYAMFERLDGANVAFPRLTMDDLIMISCGIYQVRQAKSYTAEHFKTHGIYTIEICRAQIPGLRGNNPELIRTKIKSRFVSGRTYYVYIVFEQNMDGIDSILSYCCNCIVGLRTAGCCSHVMSIIYYLGLARHEGLIHPASFLDDILISDEYTNVL